MKTAWKFLMERDGKIVSQFDGSPWVIGKWRKVDAPTRACIGLNCSKLINHAWSYVNGDVVAEVEYKGVVVASEDKLTCQYMRIKRAWLLPATAWKAYNKACAPAQKAHNEACATAWKAYNEACAPAQKAHNEACATAWKAYNEARATAWKAYNEVRAAAQKAYNEARATAWKKTLLSLEEIK